MKEIRTDQAPQPAGHYAQAVVHNGLVFVSGQLAVDPQTGEKRIGSIEEQTEQALRNVDAILQDAGSAIDQVLATTAYVADISLWGRVHSVYAECFGDQRTARAIIPTKELHHGLLVEIDAIAAVES